MKDNLRTHRRRIFWQILAPLILGSLIIAGLGIWAAAAAAGGSDVSRFADASAVILIIPVMGFSLLPLAIIGLLAYGISRLRSIIPRGTQKVRRFMDRVRGGVETASKKAVGPMIRIQSTWAGLKAAFCRRDISL